MLRTLKLTAVMSVAFASPALADDLIGVGGTAFSVRGIVKRRL